MVLFCLDKPMSGWYFPLGRDRFLPSPYLVLVPMKKAQVQSPQALRSSIYLFIIVIIKTFRLALAFLYISPFLTVFRVYFVLIVIYIIIYLFTYCFVRPNIIFIFRRLLPRAASPLLSYFSPFIFFIFLRFMIFFVFCFMYLFPFLVVALDALYTSQLFYRSALIFGS